MRHSTTVAATAASPPKPILRGYSHAVAAVGALAAAPLLLGRADGDAPRQLALLIYALSAVLLFSCSALYHTLPARPRRRAVLRRLDHASIFVMIAGAYTPIAYTMLAGWWRVGLCAGVWGVTLAGVVAVVAPRPVSRRVRIGLYVVAAWLAVLVSLTILIPLGLHGLRLPVAGGLLFMAGALVYALRRPVLWPRVFGYHELFHLTVVGGNVAFFLFMAQYVAPLTRH